MLKREHLKQAIEAIARRDTETGYALDQMLSMDRIRPIPPGAGMPDNLSGEDFYFTFDDNPATVKRVIFFNEGTVPIEQRLLIKYGEMLKKHQLRQNSDGNGFRERAEQIRLAGLRFMVNHEIDHVVARLRGPGTGTVPGDTPGDDRPGDPAGGFGEQARRRHLADRIASIKQNTRPVSAVSTAAGKPPDAGPVYRGTVGTDTAACFIRFPFCLDALIQVADINVDFFHVRFLIACLANGQADNLFACIVGNRIEGLVYLTFKQAGFHRALEIHYIATVRGRPADETKPALRAIRGVGTFLVAGVWMLWKTERNDCKEILLDSEIGARQFYEAVGFNPRGWSAFVLDEPRGHLPKAVLAMANRSGVVENRVIEAIVHIIERQFKILRARFRREKKKISRQHAVAAIKECLHAGALERFTQTAIRLLRKHHRQIPEAQALIRYTLDYGSDRARSAVGSTGTGEFNGIPL